MSDDYDSERESGNSLEEGASSLDSFEGRLEVMSWITPGKHSKDNHLVQICVMLVEPTDIVKYGWVDAEVVEGMFWLLEIRLRKGTLGKGNCEIMKQMCFDFQKDLAELQKNVKLSDSLQEEVKIHDSSSTLTVQITELEEAEARVKVLKTLEDEVVGLKAMRFCPRTLVPIEELNPFQDAPQGITYDDLGTSALGAPA
ncbi:unnamed protein product [Vicia faba]|uniref:Uncharacterized protein n=1 Tax=Vicia faba TaxID=3906 RepID=A0AAV0ZG54_VICFA|nr:unnamed protein product [Vicia faba]